MMSCGSMSIIFMQRYMSLPNWVFKRCSTCDVESFAFGEDGFGLVAKVVHTAVDKPTAQELRVGDQIGDREGVGEDGEVWVDSTLEGFVVEEVAADVCVPHALRLTVLADVHQVDVVVVRLRDVSVA